MNRAALKPLITTALMGVAGVLGWVFWIGDPCLGTAIGNHWTVRNPPDISPPVAADSAGTVVVENPYGMTTCDNWPTAADEVLNTSVFVIITLAIGWLSARRISQRPLRAAAIISVVAMLIAAGLQYWARWEMLSRFLTNDSTGSLRYELLAALAFFLITAGIAMFGAWVTLRFTRRA